MTDEVKEYIDRSNHYWRQARELLDKGELEKASEVGWGSVVERLKGLAWAKTGTLLKRHRQLRNYVRLLADQLRDPELFSFFREAERLHINFYESYFDQQEVRLALLNAEALLAKIDSLLQPR